MIQNFKVCKATEKSTVFLDQSINFLIVFEALTKVYVKICLASKIRFKMIIGLKNQSITEFFLFDEIDAMKTYYLAF